MLREGVEDWDRGTDLGRGRGGGRAPYLENRENEEAKRKKRLRRKKTSRSRIRRMERRK